MKKVDRATIKTGNGQRGKRTSTAAREKRSGRPGERAGAMSVMPEKILENMQCGVALTDLSGTIHYVNPTLLEMHGYTSEEVIGKNISIFTPSKLWDAKTLEKVRSLKSLKVENINIRKDGSRFLTNSMSDVISDGDGSDNAVVILYEDITKQKHRVNVWRSFERAVENMQLGVTITDLEGKILYTNEAEARMHGYSIEELIGRDVRIFAPLKTWNPMSLKKIKLIKRFKRESVNVRKDGSRFTAQLMSDVVKDDEGRPIGIVTTSEDITERKKVEEALEKAYAEMKIRVRENTDELSKALGILNQHIAERRKAEEEKLKLQSQLFQSQKMEAVGQLAGGLAHDFNNILTAIMGYGNLLEMKMKGDDPLKIKVQGIIESAEKGALLTNDLLSFSRERIANPKPVNVNLIVRNAEKLLRRLIGENIDLVTELTDDEVAVMSDGLQLEQVLMNLATNARDAMPQGGSITVTTSLVDLDRKKASPLVVKPGRYACISFRDTGKGIDSRNLEKLFEPFFTTKAPKKGTGLGLSVTYWIIKQHNGAIEVSSEKGAGTTFTIYIPLTDKRPETVKVEEAPSPGRGKETILVVEDDEAVRCLICESLRTFGYQVAEAGDGEEAVELFREYRKKIGLTILDTVMPKKNGAEVFLEIRKIEPDPKVIFMSGHPLNILDNIGIPRGKLNFLPKPFTPSKLLNQIREVLDS